MHRQSEVGGPNKVLIVTALAGFIRSFLLSDIETLQSMGLEVHCAANANHSGSDGVVDCIERAGAIFHQVDFSSTKPLSLQSFRAWNQLRTLRASNSYALIHCHTPIAGALARTVFCGDRKTGTKIVYTTHGFFFHRRSSGVRQNTYRLIENVLSKQTDMIITINREDFKSAQAMRCADVKYVPGVGVDIERFHAVTVDRTAYRKRLGLSDDDYVILAVGELSRRKNHKVIIEALSKCAIEDAVFVICGGSVGDPTIKFQLEELAKRQNVDLRLLGMRDDIPEVCKCADVGVLPSLREGLGLAGIEMIAAGLPLVGSDVQGIPDYLIDGVNGYLCDPHSPDEFAVALLKLHDAKTRSNLIQAGVRSVMAYDIRKSKCAMKSLYKQLLG